MDVNSGEKKGRGTHQRSPPYQIAEYVYPLLMFHGTCSHSGGVQLNEERPAVT